MHPRRKPLPHHRPAWVDPNAVHFITINCQPRGTNQLAVTDCWESLRSCVYDLEAKGSWSVLLLLAMPDHLHFLARIASGETISSTVGAFKWRVSMATKVQWQRQWFDHRLRDERQQLQLERYIRENPVRAGLVDIAEKWPYVFRKAPGKVE